ncbi:MAG: hypothetical protein UGE23_11190, partial [Peptococcaceae bacterium]|nr:hypothetical protein [Peptococcaceae bacterium]
VNSSTAMTAVAASSTAMTAVAASSTAMTAVAASSTAMTAVANSSNAMSKVTGSAVAMKALWQRHKTSPLPVAFCRKFNVSVYTSDNIPGESIGTAWLNKNSSSSNANTLHANSMPNNVMIVQSTGEALTYDAIELAEGNGCGEYGVNSVQNSADGSRIICHTANQILFTYSAQKCYLHADSSNSALQKLSYVTW